MAKDAYEKFYDRMSDVYDPPMTREHFFEDDRFANVAEWVAEGRPGQWILDAGCGNGWLASLYRGGNNVVALDLADANLKKIQRLGIQPIKSNLDHALPFADGAFDTVVCSETLEHLFGPEHLLRESFRVLKPGGRLILTVPNLHCIRNRRDMIFGKYTPFIEYRVYEDRTDPLSNVGVQHIHHYTVRGMRSTLRAIGFEDLRRRGQSFHMNFSLPFRLISALHGGNRGLRLFLKVVSFGRIRSEIPGLVLRFKIIRMLGKLFPTLACGMLFAAKKP